MSGFSKKNNNSRLATRINNELDNIRPKWEDFRGIYSAQRIKADKAELEEYRKRKGINPSKERNKLKDGILVEKVFFDAEINGFLKENSLPEESFTDAEEDFLFFAIPAHEYDDTFNNVDMVCLVRSSLTNHKTIPFAVDCTSNPLKVEDKMNYKRTADKIVGFTDVDYFKNTVNHEDAKPRKIEKIPRFVVGFDADLARDVVTFNYNDWPKEDLDQKYNQINYYILTELTTQAKFYDTELNKFFDRLLEFFLETRRKSDISSYPKDAVMEEVLSSINKKQNPQ